HHHHEQHQQRSQPSCQPGWFPLPPNFDFNRLSRRDTRIRVVAFVGRSDPRLCPSKTLQLELQLLDRPAFQPPLLGNGFESDGATVADDVDSTADKSASDQQQLVRLHGFYSPGKRAVFLSLTGPNDPAHLAHLCAAFVRDLNPDTPNVAAMLTAADFDNIRALLYLFSVSHVVVFNCIGTQVNPAVTRTLQLVSQLRQQLLGQLCQAYRSFPVPRDWTLNGRTSCPAVLFHFQLSPGNLTKQLIDGGHERALADSLQCQIYQIFRRAKLITGPEAGNLCRLPDGGFCCVSPPAPASPSGVFQSLLELDDPVDLTDDQLLDNEFMQSLTGGSYNREFARFLERHMNQAEAEGGVGGGPLDLVSAKSWFKVCHKLHKLLLTDLDPGVQRVMSEFKARCDIVRKFSETRCASALPLAESVYREGLPAHYSHRVHTERIRKAQQVFLDNARGPAADKYLAELEARCNSVWLSGRQMCEALSVTSHPCVNERHSLPGTSADQQQQLPAMPHSSAYTSMRAACSCGRLLESRPDPFNWEEANVHFYSRLIDSCCGQHQPVPLPVYQRRGSEDKTQPQYTEELSNSGDLLPPLRSPELDDVELDQPSATLPTRTPLALAVEHSNYDEDEQLLLEEEADLKRKQRQCLKLESPIETGLSASNNTEVSIRQLKGMMTEDLIGRYLPLVQSWCLLSVGRYNSYSHANGIGQPGFSSGSNHLLPWNVPVASKLWQQQQQQQQQSSQYRSTRREPTAKAWFGFEHECPFGHRFFVSSPGQMMRGAMQATQVKEGVQRLLSEDLPLFIPCHCHKSKGAFAQLMRVWVAAPQAPVRIRLNPRVRFAAPSPDSSAPAVAETGGESAATSVSAAPVFLPGNPEPIPLGPGDLWVLRLPFAYEDVRRRVLYKQPRDLTEASVPRLLRECISVIQMP
ncbi:hypothetical protein BOX15_Mlig002965g1, partial [Macrostomum lignano]